MRVGVVKEQDGGSAGIDVIRLTARSGRTTRDRDVHRSPDTQISLRRSTSNFTSPSSYRKQLDNLVALSVFLDLRTSIRHASIALFPMSRLLGASGPVSLDQTAS